MTPKRRTALLITFVVLAFAAWLAFLTLTKAPAPGQGSEGVDGGISDGDASVAQAIDDEGIVDLYVRITPARIAEFDAAMATAGVARAVHATQTPNGPVGLCNIGLAGVGDDTFAERLGEAIATCDDRLGIFLPRSLGLGIRRRDRTLLQIDDPMLDPIFSSGKPVVIESGGPAAWFEGEGPFAGETPEGESWPSATQLRTHLLNRIGRHPEQTFILVDWANATDGSELTTLIDAGRVFIVTSGPPPPSSGTLIEAHPERFLFGTGLTVTPERLRRGLEGIPVATIAEAWTEGLAELDALELRPEIRSRVTRGNALALFDFL